MKEREMFNVLGNAEEDSMEMLTDKCPEITDAQLDRLLAETERKYKMKKKDNDRTEKDNINMTENEVSGVERVSRPAWMMPLITAASVVLVAGIVLGSVVLLNRHKGGDGGGVDSPMITASTTAVSETTTSAVSTGTVTTTGTVTKAGSSTADRNTTNTAAAHEAVTSKTHAEAPVNTTAPFVAPDKNYVKDNKSLGDKAIELCRKSDEIKQAVLGLSVDCDVNDRIMFSVDPSMEWLEYDAITQERIENMITYCRVRDSRFGTLDEMKSYFRSALTEKSIKEMYDQDFSARFDDLNEMDVLPKDRVSLYMEYRGKLYIMNYRGGLGYIPVDYPEELPVIIAEKTDTSFRAFMPVWMVRDTSKSEKNDIQNTYALEVKVIMDPEYNDWRIDELTTRERKDYDDLYDQFRS